MAGGYHLFSTGEVLTAANVDNYLMNQTVMVFASAAARTTALSGVLAEGMCSYRTDAHVFEVYNGTAWVASETNLTTKGDLATFDTAPARLAVGNNGEALVANSATATGLSWNPRNSAGKNKIANGDFGLWNRGTSIALAASTGYANGYSADRWDTTTGANQAITISRQATADTTNLPNIQYCARYQRNSGQTGVTNLLFGQSLETINSIPFAGKSVTVSFYARAGANYSAASNILTAVINTGTGTDQNFNAGYTGSANTIVGNATLTTTWQRFTFTGTIASTVTELAAYFQFTPTGTAGAADYFEITGVQLELGSVATTFTPSGGNSNLEAASSGSPAQDGILFSGNTATNPSGSGTNSWAGYTPAGKNAVINGGFDIWQRGTSSTTIANYATADRWWNYSNPGTCTFSQESTIVPAGFRYSLKATQSVSNSTNFQVTQAIETANAIQYAGQNVTLSFYAAASASVTLSAIVYYSTATDVAPGGSWTAITATTNNPVTVSTTNFSRGNATFAIPLTAKSLYVLITSSSLTSGTSVYISGIQLELGTVPTTFARAGGTIQGELAACQRYYIRLNPSGNYATLNTSGAATSTTVAQMNASLPIQMRVFPTSMDYANIVASDLTNLTTGGTFVLLTTAGTPSYPAVRYTAGSAVFTQYRPMFIADAGLSAGYIGFSAEL